MCVRPRNDCNGNRFCSWDTMSENLGVIKVVLHIVKKGVNTMPENLLESFSIQKLSDHSQRMLRLIRRHHVPSIIDLQECKPFGRP